MNDTFIDDLDNDELDLMKLVSTNANDLNQYLVFRGSTNDLFALNVSKVEEVLVYDKNIKIAKNNDTQNLIYGTADIRELMTTIVYFDDWYENIHLDDEEYELIILVNYGGQKLGLIVKEVINISTIEAKEMSDNSPNNAKTTFVSKIKIENKEEICIIYDGDKMLQDIFGKSYYGLSSSVSTADMKLLLGKVAYFADDSKLVRNLVEDLFLKLHLEYKIFTDGSFLIEHLHNNIQEKVDIIITDLEMPNMGGLEVVNNIRQNSTLNDVKVLVHTNMSNDIMKEELLSIGTDVVIEKMNMNELSNIILRELS